MKGKNEEDIDADLAALEAEVEAEENLKNPKPKPKPKKDIKNEPDIYPEFIENKYHNFERMICLGVLEKEKTLCYKIINYKKKIEKDYYIWEIKKKSIDKKIKSITSLIEKGTWDLNLYKNKIKEELNDEKNLLISTENEYNLTETQKNILKERLNERINILEGELNEANKQEIKNKEKEDIDKDLEELNQFLNDNINNNNLDIYPSTVEDIYHNIGKYISLGVLEKEKELCDKIIEYKKNKNMEYNNWTNKKEKIDETINMVTSFVQDGKWDLEKYKEKIKDEKDWDKKLIELLANDTSLEETQKKITKGRIMYRIKIIDDELSKNPEEDE